VKGKSDVTESQRADPTQNGASRIPPGERMPGDGDADGSRDGLKRRRSERRACGLGYGEIQEEKIITRLYPHAVSACMVVNNDDSYTIVIDAINYARYG
jgi:hypothetical protein